jgi:hypothetical protein
MSIQPKGSPMLRKKFLMQLPPLMKDLNEGMQLLGWPERPSANCSGKLLPAHAESLKSPPLSELDFNLMAKQLEASSTRRSRAPIRPRRSASCPRSTRRPSSSASRRKRPRRSASCRKARSTGTVHVDIDLSAEEPAESTAGTALHRSRSTPARRR